MTNPHVLPLYIPGKLLAQEISYKITENNLSRNLKTSKKQIWPTFPLKSGSYTLNDFKHAEKEALKIKELKLAFIAPRQYDPKKIALNVTSTVQIAKFEHEDDIFDDLFVSAEVFA